MDNKYTVGIITASDKGSNGEREDISGRRIREILPAENYEVVSYKAVSYTHLDIRFAAFRNSGLFFGRINQSFDRIDRFLRIIIRFAHTTANQMCIRDRNTAASYQ